MENLDPIVAISAVVDKTVDICTLFNAWANSLPQTPAEQVYMILGVDLASVTAQSMAAIQDIVVKYSVENDDVLNLYDNIRRHTDATRLTK